MAVTLVTSSEKGAIAAKLNTPYDNLVTSSEKRCDSGKIEVYVWQSDHKL